MENYLLALGASNTATRPSFLEVIAHESTHVLWPPFIEYAIEQARILAKYRSWLPTAIVTVIEAFHLIRHSKHNGISFSLLLVDGSLTECLYGFHRTCDRSRLGISQIVISIVELVWSNIFYLFL